MTAETNADNPIKAAALIVVVPCYNEEKRLPVEAFRAFLRDMPDVRFLFVNDGSRDGTRQVLEKLVATAPDRLACHHLAQNSGKAEAVRQGLLQAIERGAGLVAFWDADLATGLDEIPLFLNEFASRPGLELVMGSRVKLLGRHIERKLFRHIIGRIFATTASNYLRLPVYDTQCGAKMFLVTEVLRGVLAHRFTARWLFDVEILVRLMRAWRRQRGRPATQRIVEVPLRAWHDVKGSKVKSGDFLKAIGEFAALVRRYGWRP